MLIFLSLYNEAVSAPNFELLGLSLVLDICMRTLDIFPAILSDQNG